MLLDSIIDEIREENVVHIATDSASAYMAAGKMLIEKRKHHILFEWCCSTSESVKIS